MKKIKQIITVVALAIFMLGSFSGNAQEIKKYQLKIPVEFQVSKKNENKLKIYKNYDKELGVIITVVGYVDKEGNVYFKSVTFSSKPKNLEISKQSTADKKAAIARVEPCSGGSYKACARDCARNSGSNFGMIMCTVYCMIDC